jgi:hypothetical protein
MMAAMLLFAVVRQQQPAIPATTDTAGGRPCKIVIDSVGRQAQQVEVRPGETNVFAGGGVLAHCEGTGSTLAADTVAWFAGVRRFDMIGQRNVVHIRDTVMTLDATTASYFLGQERLEAHKNVVAVNRSTGSVLRGPNLMYYRAVKGVRDTVEMYASGRPTIDYHATADSAEPYLIVADRVRFKGNDRMWGGGQVTIDRSDVAARGDSMHLDQAVGFAVLVGGPPRVAGKGPQAYTLTGTRIELGLRGHDIQRVKALGHGVATDADWRMTADTIHLDLDKKLLQRAFAWGPRDSVRAHAVSTRTTIQADSLALDLPDQVLTEARAFGHAFSTMQRDSTAKPRRVATKDSGAKGSGAKTDSGVADMDWITGDSLTARWIQVADSSGAKQSSRLRRLIARGSARSFTHLYGEHDTTSGPSLNYTRGKVIDLAIRGDKVETVVVTGRADGVQLEPKPPAPDTTKQPSLAADTTKKPRTPADTTKKKKPRP